jgi:hypothetical protein
MSAGQAFFYIVRKRDWEQFIAAAGLIPEAHIVAGPSQFKKGMVLIGNAPLPELDNHGTPGP